MGCCPILSIVEHPKIEALPEGWKTVELTFRHRDGKRQSRLEIIDPKQGRWMHEQMGITAMKCLMLLAGIPIYLALTIAWHAFRTPITFTATLIGSFVKLVCHPDGEHLKQFLVGAPLALIQGMWNIVRAPFYAIAMEFAALYGVFRPIEGRVFVSQVERKWHGVDRTKDARFQDPDLDPKFVLKAVGDKDFDHVWFLAFCMQPYGTLTDGHIDPQSIRTQEPESEPPKVGRLDPEPQLV